MNLENFLLENKERIVKKWFERLIATYPRDSQGFFKKERDRFSNPVGRSLAEGLDKLYLQVIEGGEHGKTAACLDEIIKIRAVQDFKPSEAVAFVLQLKETVRDFLGEDFHGNGTTGELNALDKKIDETALLAFDIYAARSRQIYELRVNEVKRQVSRLLVRANLVCDISDAAPDSENN